MVNDLSQVVTALNAVRDLAEDLPDLVLDRVRPAGLLLERLQVREQPVSHEFCEIIADHGDVVVNLAILPLRCRPCFPAVRLVEDVRVLSAFQFRFCGLVSFQSVQILQEQQPGRFFGVVQFTGTSGFLAKNVVDVFEGLFEHEPAVVFLLPFTTLHARRSGWIVGFSALLSAIVSIT